MIISYVCVCVCVCVCVRVRVRVRVRVIAKAEQNTNETLQLCYQAIGLTNLLHLSVDGTRTRGGLDDYRI